MSPPPVLSQSTTRLLLRRGRFRLGTAGTGTLALLTRTNLLISGAFALRLICTSNWCSDRLLAAVLLRAFLVVAVLLRALLLTTSERAGGLWAVGAGALALLTTADRSISTA